LIESNSSRYSCAIQTSRVGFSILQNWLKALAGPIGSTSEHESIGTLMNGFLEVRHGQHSPRPIGDKSVMSDDSGTPQSNKALVLTTPPLARR
jgi:hypothetical protein